jgi:hypothetical protein
MAAPTELTDQMALLQTLSDIKGAMDTFTSDPSLDCMNGVCDVLANLAYPMREIEFADNDDKQVELLRTLELHGDGLRPCAAGFKFQPRDLLIAQDRTMWVVTTVDDEGKIQQISGSAQPKSQKSQDMQFMWRPAKQARIWLRPGETAAPGYVDLDQAMAYLVRLWGEEKSDDGRDLTTPTGFFAEFLHAPGVKIDGGDLDELAETDDVITFCNGKGAGLRLYARDTKTVPGDLLWMKSKAWALVTRTADDGSPVDALVGGLAGDGDLGIGGNAVKLVRGVAVDGIDRVWHPAP